MFEVDFFSRNRENITSVRDAVAEQIMKCFGLTGAKERLVTISQANHPISKVIKDRLKETSAISQALFEQLKNREERIIVRELKKRGSILERDLGEIKVPTVNAERIKSILDFLSGDEYRLVERRQAIICTKTDEIIFLSPSREKIDDVKDLECPKCSRPLGEEGIMSHYGVTDQLKQLLDGNRWMPLLAQEAFLKAGVPASNIYVEVKHGEDEIDLLVFYRGKVLVIEAKDRPISLNDAYKLSAKTNRLQSILSRTYDAEMVDEFDGAEFIVEGKGWRSRSRRRGIESDFLPIAISTMDIAKDAQDLLSESMENALFLENSEENLPGFAAQLIVSFDQSDARRRFRSLTNLQDSDACSNLAAQQFSLSFMSWWKTQFVEEEKR